MSPFDLHVLSTPPAFILSQDQTLMLKYDPLRGSLTAKSFVWFLHQLNWLIHPLHFWCDCIKTLLLFKGFVLWIFYNKNFSFRIFRVALLFICQGSIYYFSIIWLSKIPSGEDGIWTHAPLLTTYSLSRGAPSASLGTSPNGRNKNGEGGIRTHAPLRTNGFQDRLVMTTSIPLHLSNCLAAFWRHELFYHIIILSSICIFIFLYITIK